MTSAAEPRHRGTLVCVVLKAKNLPNKRSIGKQDPYCVLALGSETQKTDPDKKGGQHPVWDSQLHFEIYEDVEDMLKRTAGDADVDANATIKAGSSASAAKKAKGTNKALKVTCYADDKNEPEFIGEGIIDLTETLKSGEFDGEWCYASADACNTVCTECGYSICATADTTQSGSLSKRRIATLVRSTWSSPFTHQ